MENKSNIIVKIQCTNEITHLQLQENKNNWNISDEKLLKEIESLKKNNTNKLNEIAKLRDKETKLINEIKLLKNSC